MYPRSSFWNSANDLRSQVGSGQRLVCCDCAGKRPCPNGYGRIEQDDGENHQPPAGKAGGVPCVRGRSGKYGRVEPRGREEVQQRPESLAVQPPTVTAAASRCMQPDPSAGTQLRRPWETSRPERSDDATRSKMGEARTVERGIYLKNEGQATVCDGQGAAVGVKRRAADSSKQGSKLKLTKAGGKNRNSPPLLRQTTLSFPTERMQIVRSSEEIRRAEPQLVQPLVVELPQESREEEQHLARLAAEERHLAEKLVSMGRERKRRANLIDNDDPQVTGVPLEELYGYRPFSDMGKQNLMDRLVRLNSEDCCLEEALCVLRATAERIQTTAGRLRRESTAEVAVQEELEISTTRYADLGGGVCLNGPPRR